MKPKSNIPALFLMLAVLGVPSLAAQDRFGGAVAVRGKEAFVVKPVTARGPAAIYVYRQVDGRWESTGRLYADGASETGQGLSTSIAMADDLLVVGSGDPGLVWGAHTFQSGADGWAGTGGIALDPNADASPPDAVDLATVMRILRPPRRTVAAWANLTAVSVIGGPAGLRGVRIYDRTAGEWTLQATVVPEAGRGNDQFGAAITLGDGRVLVGAPRGGSSGAAYVFARGETGTWSQAAVLEATDLPRSSGLGTTVMLADDVALVGAPGTASTPGTVVVFYRDEDTGTWREITRLSPEDGAPGDRFGSSLSGGGNELWIGAPGANEARGRVHRYIWDPDAGELRETDNIAPADLGSRSLFGASVAVSEDLAVVGAPMANAAAGRVAVFTRGPDGDWSDPEWLGIESQLAAVSGDEVRCDDGKAAGFACDKVDLLAFLPTSALGGDQGEGLTDLWGWTDPETRREYALVGRRSGAAIVDVTNPTEPVYLGVVRGNPAGLRDLKVYQNHLFFVADGAGNHGMVVFDLTRLRGLTGPPATFEPDTVYNGIASAHNLIIDTESGFAYPVGASGGGETCGGGLHMVDIREPKNPTFAGCYTDTEGLIWQGRTHDGQCVVYRGPDQRYAGRQVCFVSNETALRIVDVTDKANPEPLSAARYPKLAYVHQGWLTEDQRYFYMDDEVDELVGLANRTRTMLWDVAELDDPILVGEFFGPEAATDHNLLIKGDRMYQANYQAGLRVWDVSDPEQPFEIGYFDTAPYEGNPAGFSGAFTAYPFFESGIVIVSSMLEGLFVLRPRRQALVP